MAWEYGQPHQSLLSNIGLAQTVGQPIVCHRKE